MAPDNTREARRTAVALLVLGQGCLQTWLFVTLFSPVIHGQSMSDVGLLGTITMAWCIGFVAAMLLGALPWPHLPRHGSSHDGPCAKHPALATSWRPSRGMRLSMVGTGLVLCLCTLLLDGDLMGESTWPRLCASALSGVATAAHSRCWGVALTASYSRLTGIYAGGAFVVAACALIVIAKLPDVAATAVTMLLPLGSAALFLPWRAPGATPTPRTHPLAGRPFEPDGTEARPRPPVTPFVRALIGIALLGFAESFSRTLFQAPGAIADPAYPWALLLATIVAAGVVSLASLARPERDSIGRVNHVLMLVMALLLALMPALQGLGLATDAANLVCRLMFYLIIEVLFAQVSIVHGLDARASFSLGYGIGNLGCVAGILLGKQLAPFVATGLPDGFRLQVVCAVGCAVLVFAAFLFVVDERTFVELFRANDPQERPQARRFTLRCDHVAQQFGLSAKQTEVMVLAAKGNTSQRIAETMGISVGTVNVHLNHAYRKMGVHSRQEMLDLIETTDAC